MNKDIQCLTWQDMRDDFYRTNKKLAEIIDRINPTKEMRLYRVQYPYGAHVVQNGIVHYPLGNDELAPLQDIRHPKIMQEDLNYEFQIQPVAYLLDKSFELYLPYSTRPVPAPFMLFKKGDLVNMYSSMNQPSILHNPMHLWNCTAGARSIAMLPKISKFKNYQRIQRKYGYPIKTPASLFDHWSVFKEFSDYHFLDEWKLTMVFFAKEWFTHFDERSHAELREYFNQQLNINLSFWTNQQIWNAYFSILQNKSGIQPSPYTSDTVKHLLLLSIGALPGMAPTQDEQLAPIKRLQELFVEDYRLINYLPIILGPTYFNPFVKSQPIYYSLHYPNAFELAFKGSDYSSTIVELYEIKDLLHIYLQEFSSPDLNISHTVMSQIPDMVSFEFFHSNPNNYHGITSSETLFNDDALFQTIKHESDRIKNISHPLSCSFVRGCVKIKNKT